MQFTLATFVTLVAAVAAMPQKTENNVHQSSNKEDLDVLQAKCGDLIVNCCVVVDKDEHNQKGLNLLNNIIPIDSDKASHCSPFSSNSILGLNLAQLLALEPDEKLCNVPGVTYACCDGGKCEEIGSEVNDDEKKRDY
ncbi:hypothetical protein BJY01DRAFT_248861 [Aspergillus pseudoustus]|uniref:Hydrophobin n=1 Tax=Aspergillus pseudoustus TaxID=1810923 RepID=A0ABR4JSV1_9EURO